MSLETSTGRIEPSVVDTRRDCERLSRGEVKEFEGGAKTVRLNSLKDLIEVSFVNDERV